MKIKGRYLFFLALAAIIILSDCKGDSKKEPESTLNKCTKYACPVHTDKTSATLDNCPECNSLMIPVKDSLKKDSL